MIEPYVVSVVGVVALGVGFLAGLWTYAHVYKHFVKREEDRAQRRIALAVQGAKSERNRSQEIINRAKAIYGPALNGDKEAVLTEEVERVLSSMGGRANAR